MSVPEARSSAVKTTVIAAIVVVVAFIAGFVVGAVTDRFMARHRPGPMRPMVEHAMVNRLDRELDLTPAQRGQVEEIIGRHHTRIDGIWSSVRPRVRQEIDQANAEIAKILTPEQRLKFEKLKMRLGGHRDRGHRSRGGRPRTESTK